MRKKVVGVALFILLMIMFVPKVESQETHYDDFASLLRAISITIHLNSWIDTFSVAYDKTTGFLYGFETGIPTNATVFGFFPAELPKMAGKILVLNIEDYTGDPTLRYFYFFNYSTGIVTWYLYDGSGAPQYVGSDGWYYTYDIGNNSSTEGLRNTQEID